MKTFQSFVVVLLTAVLLASCGGEKEGTVSQEVKKDSLTIAVLADPATFDLFVATSMLEGQIGNNIYDNLLFFDDQGNIKPYLAERHEVSNDGLEYTFWLRKGVKFHNGEELKADDVAFSIEYGKDTPLGQDTCSIIGKVEVIDDYTIKLFLSEPYASFMSELCGDQFPIYNRKALTEATAGGQAYGANPVGTGSYKFVSREAGVEVKFEAFQDHFQGPAPIRYLTYRIIPDDFTAGVALQTGEVDFIWTIGAATATSLGEDSNLTVTQDPSNRVNFITMNTEKPPFNNVKLRQAVNYAIDRDAVRDIVYEGNSTNKDHMAFPWMAGYAEPAVKYNYDPAKAVALAMEVGVSKDKPVTVSYIYTASSQKVGEAIQPYLAEIGINLTLDVMEYNSWATDYYGGNFQLSGSGYYMVYKDLQLVGWFYTSSNIGWTNGARYRNAAADALFEQGKKEIDPARRSIIYKQALDIIQQDAPYAVYANPSTIRAYNKNLNIAYSYANGIFIRDISWN
ncbi:MAG: ABC transporter substrate-binding protein [Spirochaetaceae bacterium]|jgi:peptide/nickel transport system substrate-binding protein|nr:ABC transporter substrate-binding protein [Spirochaetaceae bacterium]